MNREMTGLCVGLALVLCSGCTGDADRHPGPTPEEQALDREHVCELRAECALESPHIEFSFENCIEDLEGRAEHSDECEQLYAVRNECFRDLETCSELQLAIDDPDHPCGRLDADAQFTFCGPVAETSDGGS